MSTPSPAFRARIREGLGNAVLQEALGRATRSFLISRLKALSDLPDAETVRDRARAIRAHTIAHLDRYLEQFAQEVERHGGKVFWAATAREACDYIVSLARSRGIPMVAKSKSMVSEEIGLNHTLEAAGIRVVETDLGEFIIQLAGERPSHIITPAIHKRREDVSQIFQKHLGMPPTHEISEMTAAARRALRQVFLDARMGISGVNFGIAETGTLVLVTNEGNGRMVTTLPPIHVALMGIERVVPTWEDTEILLRVLARSATGQALTAYTSFLTGPRRRGEPDGPEELHVVLVDNGRSRWLGTPLEEALYCIRCGACLNACPVYQAIGGHAYGSVYPGPIGSIVTPMLGEGNGAELAYASSLCGACQEVCPVRIAIPDLLVRWRQMRAGSLLPAWERLGLRGYAWAARHPSVWARIGRWAMALLRRIGREGWLRRGPGPLRAWTAVRDFPVPRRSAFRDWWASRKGDHR
ncbi:LutB/LldF family L-lactate oxidation iron-sulfur protein [Thermoflexus sp.]|uniref:LutB/LldF family L-lactate oxidation iron-sulfur protein n=1 Tax=Thermoflexus sp. TaxID=1969742 RepID=UPI0025FF030F|nr:LutB/LldF family L-lactate oxidation iron-sulfur protein [Thermoflexus sp.]MDW8181760.1 LutB/LldF family L-lactate oxidation iron-sulfur protein [Anaerolineae bacterium]MCS6964082.1 LutB/LldF family L-lactate oxidation iron-sulfur protein [Thermoflexus sp.]MCS7352297.1 LutB/LldF family L-lactate oxidation iron-sulfur protein [Thermoflexus sp.]MCX7689386.1 LutB/LldF family L-lactate oxidation iron-sulfur protein [Thermoflexus sp.]MDW8183940.1 LutB/LldF family L-lactate oxidation iron-sulfur 